MMVQETLGKKINCYHAWWRQSTVTSCTANLANLSWKSNNAILNVPQKYWSSLLTYLFSECRNILSEERRRIYFLDELFWELYLKLSYCTCRICKGHYLQSLIWDNVLYYCNVSLIWDTVCKESTIHREQGARQKVGKENNIPCIFFSKVRCRDSECTYDHTWLKQFFMEEYERYIFLFYFMTTKGSIVSFLEVYSKERKGLFKLTILNWTGVFFFYFNPILIFSIPPKRLSA